MVDGGAPTLPGQVKRSKALVARGFWRERAVRL